MITLTAKIYISDTEIIEVDRKNMLSIESSIFDRSDLKLPSFGIISNQGNIEFSDYSGEIRLYAESLKLTSGQKCEIWLNNTLVEGASKMIGQFETNQWDYDNDNRIASVSIKDDLEEWQDTNVESINYDAQNPIAKNVGFFYDYLWELTSNRSFTNKNGEQHIGKGNYNMLSLNELDNKTKNELNNTYIQYPFLESANLWQQWTKLCHVCRLHIYKNFEGIIVCKYNGGN